MGKCDIISNPSGQNENASSEFGHAHRYLGWAVLLGAAHFFTELGCSFSLTQTLDNSDLRQNGVLLFNALAFGAQPMIGWAVDRWQTTRLVATVGSMLVLAAIFTSGTAPWPTVVLLGLGNACFHVGAGALCIELSRGQAGGLGLFVGPGALGLTIGVGLARTPIPYAPAILGVLILSIIGCIWFIDERRAVRTLWRQGRSVPFGKVSLLVVVTLVLVCIAIRSYVGLGFEFSWNTGATTALGIALALTAGKIAGGFLADRFGWIEASIAAFVLSAPLLWLGQTAAGAGLIGVALFQAPMAVTLGALARIFPARPGFAFGLASAAVYGGACLITGDNPGWLHTFGTLSLLSLIAVVMLVSALRWIRLHCDLAHSGKSQLETSR